jgi:hypothetical protein
VFDDHDILRDIEARLMEPPTERMTECSDCSGTGMDTSNETDCDCACTDHLKCSKCNASHHCPTCHGSGEVPEALSRDDEYEPD